MSNKNLRSFEEQARNVGYAYDNTQRQYDKYPPNNDVVPIAAAINVWTLVCGCYMGIEQTMKLLIRMRGSEPDMGRLGHDLAKGYGQLDPSERSLVSDYYRVYRSLHNFDTGSISLETADKFIQYVGKGYVVWRYILTEKPDNPNKLPKMHLGVMLEAWRALVDLVEHHVSGYDGRTVEGYLEGYTDGVFNDAEMTDEWQAASKLNEIREWAEHKGGILKAGIDLFHRHAHGTVNFIEASPLMSRVLLRAVDKALSGPLPTRRRADIGMFHYRISKGDLAWNADKKVFESCPAPGFDQKK